MAEKIELPGLSVLEDRAKEAFEEGAIDSLAEEVDNEQGWEPTVSESPFGRSMVMPMPAIFYLKSDRVFIADVIGSFAYTPMGILASGRFEDDEDIERDLLIPPEELRYTELLFELGDKQREAANEAEAKDFADKIAKDNEQERKDTSD